MSELWLSQFASAYEHFDRARQSSQQRNDHGQLGWANLDLSTLDLMLNDPSATRVNARRARAEFLLAQNNEGVTRALINLGTADFLSGETSTGKQEFQSAVQIDSGDESVKALAWEHLGIAALKLDSLSEADTFLNRALKSWEHLGDSASAAALYFDLAELRIKQGRIKQAEYYFGLLKVAEKEVSTGIPRYATVHLQGMLDLEKQNLPSALNNIRLAAKLALEWRDTSPPSDRLRSFVLDSLNEVLSDYILLVSQQAIATGSAALLSESFGAQVKSRALSLHEQMALFPSIKRKVMSPTYIKLLERLSLVEAEEMFDSRRTHDDAEEMRVRLSEMEQGAAMANATGTIARQPLDVNVADVQRSLSKNELMLAFYCGKKASLLWAVTGTHLSVYELASKNEIQSAGERAFTAARDDKKEKQQTLKRLADLLFSQLPSDYYSQYRSWVVVADQDISGLPLGALPGPDNRPLIFGRSIRFAPVPILATRRAEIPHKIEFVGVGDPIYNLADERLPPHGIFRSSSGPNSLLARLPGSRSELQSAAQLFGVDHAVILLGSGASFSTIRNEIEKQPVGVLHFATHFLHNPFSGTSIVLSLSHGIPELLTKDLASTLPVKGGLVVLDGCSSGQDDRASLEGVLGQARGWLIAGSPAVLVTFWPISDSKLFFSLFYKHFLYSKGNSVTYRAAEALRTAQMDMISKKRPSSEWAAYRLLAIN